MTRTQLNTTIDALAYVGFVFLTSTGLLLRYLLPPGSGGSHGVGTGQGAETKPVSLLWGLSRHEWGTVHYWVALALMAILAVHLALHWKWIVCAMRGHPRGDTSGLRLALGITGLTSVVLLACVPLMSPVDKVPRSEVQGASENRIPAEAEPQSNIRGAQTLAEVSTISGVPPSYIIAQLQLPEGVSLNDQVGRIMRSHGLEMQDLRRVLSEYQPPE